MIYLKFYELLQIIFVLTIANISVKGQTSSSVPKIIRGCFTRNFTIVARPPLTLPLLLELIGKVERNSGNVVSLRMLSSSIMHGIVFNGVRRNRNVSPDIDGVIPYSASGQEFYKYKLLVDYLIPGQIELFPVDALALPELCFLHTLISSTVDAFERGDEINTCRSQSYMPLIEGSPGGRSSCPLKQGVMSTKWGPISVNHVIAGISSGLQRNQVTFGQVANFMENTNLTKRSLQSGEVLSRNEGVNSLWVATLAANVANAILNQTTDDPYIGNEGYWNDTLLPRAFFLDTHTWDMMEPDILAGIDGVILGTYVETWLNYLDSTRLSQILDMYYSKRGIPYGYISKASNRSSVIESLLKTVNFEQQVIGSAGLLRSITSYEIYIDEHKIKTFAEVASKKFTSLLGKIATKYDTIEYLNGKELKSSIELIVILDGSYDYYKALQMIYALADGIHVSHYVSSIGIINGQTGNWITNVTRELFKIFTDINNPHENWPITLSSLSRSLHTALWYYQNKTYVDCSQSKMKPVTQTILLFSQNGRLTDNDLSASKLSLNTIKTSYPGTRVIYVTSRESSSLKQLIVDADDTIINFSSDVLSLVTRVVDKLSDLPANIVKFYCNHSQVVFEDYVTPQTGSFYEIHREYLRRGFFDTKFKNSDYGDLSVCSFKSDSPSDKRCKNLGINEEITFSSRDLCSLSSECNLQYEVNVNNSRIKCAESDCRYPDQVRLNIQYTYAAKSYLFLSSFFLIILANILVISC